MPEDKDEAAKKAAADAAKKAAEDGKGDAGDVDPKIAALQKDPDALLKVLTGLKDANAEAAKYRLKLKELADADEARKAEALKEQGKFKELAESHEAKAKAAEERLKQRTILWAVKLAAMQAGAIDPDDIAKLLDQAALKIADDGAVTGAAEAIAALAEKKPHLFAPKHDADGQGKPLVKQTPKPSLHGIVTKPDDGNLSPRQRMELALSK